MTDWITTTVVLAVIACGLWWHDSPAEKRTASPAKSAGRSRVRIRKSNPSR